MATDDLAPPAKPYTLPFRAAAVRELEGLGLALSQWRDGGVEFAEGDGSLGFLDLANCFREASLHPDAELGEFVKAYFRMAFQVDQPTQPELPKTFDDGADRIRLRIAPNPTEEGTQWVQPVPGTESLSFHIVFDFPTLVAYLPKALIEQSNTPKEDWIRRAKLNLLETTPADWLKPTDDVPAILAGQSGDSYDAARALVLTDYTNSDELGWLVAIPARDLLLCRKVEQAGISEFHFVKLFAQQAYGKYPHPISDEVFWVRPGFHWMPIPMTFGEESVQIFPPPEFVEALNLTVSAETPPDGDTSA